MEGNYHNDFCELLDKIANKNGGGGNDGGGRNDLDMMDYETDGDDRTGGDDGTDGDDGTGGDDGTDGDDGTGGDDGTDGDYGTDGDDGADMATIAFFDLQLGTAHAESHDEL